jgi:hypothetical protein
LLKYWKRGEDAGNMERESREMGCCSVVVTLLLVCAIGLLVAAAG